MIYKTKEFCSLTKKEQLSDADLVQACREMDQGLIDADLGGALYKKRVATGNKGKSSGFRTLIGAVIGEKYFFLYAFAKNKRSNISYQEQIALRELAYCLIHFDQHELKHLIETGELIKVEALPEERIKKELNEEGDNHE